MPSRFVILHHQADDGEHWDLMLERGGVLLTWQLVLEPVDRSCLPIPAKRIGDHRKAYLTYEGPLSGNRGHVRRLDAGTVDILEITATRCIFVLRDGRLSGRFELRADNEEWFFGLVTVAVGLP